MNEKPIREYRLLHDYHIGNLNTEVTHHLVKGWVLYGDPCVSRDSGSTCYAQAIVFRGDL